MTSLLVGPFRFFGAFAIGRVRRLFAVLVLECLRLSSRRRNHAWRMTAAMSLGATQRGTYDLASSSLIGSPFVGGSGDGEDRRNRAALPATP